MRFTATQQINSAFGTYHAGDDVPAEDIEPVRDAWLAAGLVEETPEPIETETAEPSDVSARKGAKAVKSTPKPKRDAGQVEKTTAPKRETTAGRRLQTQATPQRRFQTEDEPNA